MSQTTRTVTANQDGTAYTADYNDALAAMDTCHSGSSAPSDEVLDGNFWLDTSGANPILKIYRGAWVSLFTVTSGGATVNATVTPSGHTHAISDVTGLQTALTAASDSDGDINSEFNASTLNIGTKIDMGAWTITESSGHLYFANNGTNRMKLTSGGDMLVYGNITAYQGNIT